MSSGPVGELRCAADLLCLSFLPFATTSDGPAVLTDLSPLIAATTQWLTCAYPSGGGALDSALCEVQAYAYAAWKGAAALAARRDPPRPG